MGITVDATEASEAAADAADDEADIAAAPTFVVEAVDEEGIEAMRVAMSASMGFRDELADEL